MKFDEGAIESTIFQMLEAAENNGWEMLWFGHRMTGPSPIQIGQFGFGDSREERLLVLEAVDRMENELGWVRKTGEHVLKVSSQGRDALKNLQKERQPKTLNDADINAAMYKILSAAQANNWELHWLTEIDNAPSLVQVNGNPMAESGDDIQFMHEACDRMVNELGWIRNVRGILYKVCAEGRAELAKHQGGGTESMTSDYSNKVFIVHGQDDFAKHQTANVIHQVGLEPIILHEQSNGGRTIIEKLEANSDVGFAVVLLTPDDIGYSAKDDASTARPRARQNVIMELGFFMAKITRGKICVLYCEGVELPSDFHGIVYIKMDKEGAWKYELGKELKHAGFSVDISKIAR
ncbi:nucleotide-binding protein [bacterium]|nr:nucleotide-binding protein [bacterium]